MTQEALKLALKALELALSDDQPYIVKCGEAITAIKKALAQTQEPVAYLCENAVGHKYFRWKKPSSTYKPIALYTTPPQRTEQERIGFAGVKIWFGDQQVVKLLTQTELHHADDPFGLVGHASEICLATLKEMNDD